MSRLTATMDLWAGTARSISWSRYLVAPLGSVAGLGVAGPLAAAPAYLALVGEAGLAVTALAAAFIADDASADAAPATPVEAPRRLAIRAGLALPVVVAGWLAVLGVYTWVSPDPLGELGPRAWAGVGIAAAALAVSAIGGRLASVPSPGAAGAGAMVALGVGLGLVPLRWLDYLPPGPVVSGVVVGVGVGVVVRATREPRP